METFQYSDADGIGDLTGLTSRLDYLARLGATWVWLNPIQPSPNRDDGYDVTDFYEVDSRLATLGDFAELVYQVDNRGLRIILDLEACTGSDEGHEVGPFTARHRSWAESISLNAMAEAGRPRPWALGHLGAQAASCSDFNASTSISNTGRSPLKFSASNSPRPANRRGAEVRGGCAHSGATA